jgi:hypothetical protein
MSGKWQGGKGSDPRPITDRQKFGENWDRIFGKKPGPKILDSILSVEVNHVQEGEDTPFHNVVVKNSFRPEKKKILLWVLCPGYVRSKNDGQTHYISARQLRKLYELKYLDYVLTEEEFLATRRGEVRPDEIEVIKLYPLYSGEYHETKIILLAKLEAQNER